MGQFFTRVNDQSATIMKGFYMDTPQNRKLGRVGKKYDDNAVSDKKSDNSGTKGLNPGDYKAIFENPGKEVVQYAILSRIKNSSMFQGLSESEYKEFAKLLSSPANSAFSQMDLKSHYANLAKSKGAAKSENKDLTGKRVKVKTFSGSMVEGIVDHHLMHNKDRVKVHFDGGGDGDYHIDELEQAKEERKPTFKPEKPQTYHETYSSAVTSVRDYIESQGYTINEDDWFRTVTEGGKPKAETTKSSNIGLTKGGKESKKNLHIQVYRIVGPKADKFELNYYIN